MIQPEGSVIEICHVVDDMDAAIAHWTGIMNAGPFYVGDMRMEQGHRYRGTPSLFNARIGFGFTGGVLIELVQPLDGDESVFTEALKTRGPGYHHVMLREDYDTAHARLSAQGFTVALENLTPFGERCALFDTQSANGGFIEVMDLHISFGRMTAAMAAAHENWNGDAPKRSLGELFAAMSH
jgi:hypothetical protein